MVVPRRALSSEATNPASVEGDAYGRLNHDDGVEREGAAPPETSDAPSPTVSDWRAGLAGWPTEANDWNRAERCVRCGATGERLEPKGRGELVCYACAIDPLRP